MLSKGVRGRSPREKLGVLKKHFPPQIIFIFSIYKIIGRKNATNIGGVDKHLFIISTSLRRVFQVVRQLLIQNLLLLARRLHILELFRFVVGFTYSGKYPLKPHAAEGGVFFLDF